MSNLCRVWAVLKNYPLGNGFHLSALRELGSAELTGQEARKRNELRLAAHSLIGPVSVGKRGCV